ncbi:hypothetical protein DFQ00_11617 [Paenibacillus barcinonensis]|uniref:Uncharacterized protein n=1 Tax=Paenibacillus barcinonensis TaxID=198119 RepID=A0A2V4VIA1_PAEBA|nr:hypothetical protein DFQ00_11617 [Paenibacillus barcinonensis]
MKKINVLQLKQVTEYTCLDDRGPVASSVVHSMIRESVSQNIYIPNDGLTTSYKYKQSQRLETKQMIQNTKLQPKNIWHRHVLRNGANNQRWFDKLQEYRNGV